MVVVVVVVVVVIVVVVVVVVVVVSDRYLADRTCPNPNPNPKTPKTLCTLFASKLSCLL